MTTSCRSPAGASLWLVLGLTLATGAVDAVSYFTLDHVFAANMSGNLALLGIGVADGFGGVMGNVCACGGFVLGAALTGRYFRSSRAPLIAAVVPALRAELAILAALTVAIAAVELSESRVARYATCAVLAGAMGLQTGLARQLRVTDVNTTVATMTLHDLAAESWLARGPSTRWRRRAGVVACLVVGAAIGVSCDRVVRWGGMAFTCCVVAVVLGIAIRADRRARVETTAVALHAR